MAVEIAQIWGPLEHLRRKTRVGCEALICGHHVGECRCAPEEKAAEARVRGVVQKSAALTTVLS